MYNETEIEGLTLEHKQRLVIDLRTVKPGDKDFAYAKSLIDFTLALDDWEEPKKIDVVSKANTIVDGRVVEKGTQTQVYPWQFAALRRHFKTLAESSAKTTKLLVAFLALSLGLVSSARAQAFGPTTLIVGSPGQYQVIAIGGMIGQPGTNNVITGYTNTFSTNVVTSYVTNTIPSWSVVNGIPTNSPTTVITTNQSVPGLVFLGNWDSYQLHMGFNAGQGTGTNTTWRWNTSADGINWRTNELVYTLLQSTTSYVQTNAYFTPGTAPRYLCLNVVEAPTGFLYASNLLTEVSLSPRRTGP